MKQHCCEVYPCECYVATEIGIDGHLAVVGLYIPPPGDGLSRPARPGLRSDGRFAPPQSRVSDQRFNLEVLGGFILLTHLSGRWESLLTPRSTLL